MTEMADWFGSGSNNFLAALNCWGRNSGNAYFPVRHDKTDVRHSNSEETSEWFRRIVDTQFKGVPDRCKIDTQIAAICRVSWKDKIIDDLSLQILITTGGDVDDLYLGEDLENYYFRLDIDSSISGEIFREPYPHIHFRGKGEPRYPVDGLCDGNPIISFIDFIYRNYKFEVWLQWARLVWNRNAYEAGSDKDYFNNVVEAFKTNQMALIEGPYKNTVYRLKAYLAEERQRMSELRMNSDRMRLFSYIP